MNNWQYANEIPTSPWRGAMTIPRSVSLRETSEGYRLVQTPVAGLQGRAVTSAEHSLPARSRSATRASGSEEGIEEPGPGDRRRVRAR